MKNKEKRLLLVILLIIVMIIIIITLIRVSKNDDNGILINGENVFLDGSKEGQKISIDAQKQLSNIITKNEYYNLTYCVNAYQSIINDVVSSSTEENNTKILSILDNEYIQEKNITMTNIKNVYNGYRQSEIYLDEIMSIQLSNNVKAYLIKGKSVNNNIKSNSYLIIKLDNANHTYSVYPYDYVMEKSYNLLKAGDILNIEDCTSIEKKQYNEFTDQTYEYESIAYLYYDKIKADELYDAETIYNMLDQEYQNKRFGSLNNFKSYINLNKEKISNGTLTKYSREYGDGFVKYICTDSNNNDLEKVEVRVKGQVKSLTPKEFELVKYLAMQPGVPVTREVLLEKVWNYEYYGDIRTVDVTVCRIREKLGDSTKNSKIIINKRGIGYYLASK